MLYPEAKKRCRAYLIARLLALIWVVYVTGALAFALYTFVTRPTADSLEKISLPGTTNLSLKKAGLYNLYYDYVWAEPPRGLQLSVRSKKTGKEMVVNDNSANPE